MARRACVATALLALVGCAARGLPIAQPADGGAGAAGGSVDLGAPSGAIDMARPPGAIDMAVPTGPPGPDMASTRAWSVVLGPGAWTTLVNTAAIDSGERLFVTDGNNIFAVHSGAASVYLSAAAIAAAAAGATGRIESLDVGPDDTLYFLRGTRIFQSTASGNVTLSHTLTGSVVHWLGVADANRMIVFDYYEAGAEEVTAGGETPLYGGAIVMGATDCAGESVAVQRDGVFFYLPGCNGSPLVKGNLDGSGAAVLLQADLSPRLLADNFESVTRNPAGGFVASVENNAGTWNNALIQIAEDGTWSQIQTSPPMETFVNQVGDILEFHARPVAVGPDGAIYLVGRQVIYRVSP